MKWPRSAASPGCNSLSLAALSLLLAGCNGTNVTPENLAVQQQLFVQQQPDDIRSLKASYENLADQPADGQVVTVAGRIYALGMSPFDAKESVFTIIELPKPGHNHEDPGDCPFCLRELKSARIAIVRAVDSSGKTYPQPADQLLGLAKSQDIVVQGKARRVGDTLVIDLQRLYLLQAAAAAQLSEDFHKD